MAPQQLTANDLDEVLAAIRAGAAYANIHTAISPAVRSAGRFALPGIKTKTKIEEGLMTPRETTAQLAGYELG